MMRLVYSVFENYFKINKSRHFSVALSFDAVSVSSTIHSSTLDSHSVEM